MCRRVSHLTSPGPDFLRYKMELLVVPLSRSLGRLNETAKVKVCKHSFNKYSAPNMYKAVFLAPEIQQWTKIHVSFRSHRPEWESPRSLHCLHAHLITPMRPWVPGGLGVYLVHSVTISLSQTCALTQSRPTERFIGGWTPRATQGLGPPEGSVFWWQSSCHAHCTFLLSLPLCFISK